VRVHARTAGAEDLVVMVLRRDACRPATSMTRRGSTFA